VEADRVSKKNRVDQTPPPPSTDRPSAYDESFAVSQDGRPVPIVRGQRKVAGRYVMSPFYGQRIVEVPVPGGGKK
jgi:hypothetical protein